MTKYGPRIKMRVMQKGRGRLSQSLRLPRLNAKPASLQLSGVLPNSNENARTLLLHCNAAAMQCNSISGRGQFSFVQVGESVRVVSIRAFGALDISLPPIWAQDGITFLLSIQVHSQDAILIQPAKVQKPTYCLYQMTTDQRPRRVICLGGGEVAGQAPNEKQSHWH